MPTASSTYPLPDRMNELQPIKGWTTDHALDISAPMISTVTNTLPAGRVVHVTTESGSLVFSPGCIGRRMPVFLFKGMGALTVDKTAPTGLGAAGTGQLWFPVTPSGAMLGLVATGGYELASTEWTGTEGNFVPQSLLKSTNVTVTSATAGQIEYSDHTSDAYGLSVGSGVNVVGVCSRGIILNANNKKAVYFWPVYCPGLKTA